jgi:NADPH2:quinone reductase
VPGTDLKVRAAFDDMFGWCAQGRLNPETWRTWSLDGFREALNAIASREVIGRVALTLR